MQTPDKKQYRIQVEISNSTLTYNFCTILFEDETWLSFSDKFGTVFKVNKNSIKIMEELK